MKLNRLEIWLDRRSYVSRFNSERKNIESRALPIICRNDLRFMNLAGKDDGKFTDNSLADSKA